MKAAATPIDQAAAPAGHPADNAPQPKKSDNDGPEAKQWSKFLESSWSEQNRKQKAQQATAAQSQQVTAAQADKSITAQSQNATHKGPLPMSFPATMRVAMQDVSLVAYSTFKSVLSWMKSCLPVNATMLRAHRSQGNMSQSSENLQPKTSELADGTLGSAGGHSMTTHKGSVAKHFEETGFGARQSIFTWQVIASITLYAFIGANTASFVAKTFGWPWITSMLMNIFIWPVLILGAFLILIFCRTLAKKQAKKFLCDSKPLKPSSKALKDQTSALLAVDEAWCAYHVAHAAHDMCIAKINNKQGDKEVVTPESLREECQISEKRALRWYKWLAGGSALELTKGAVNVKVAELNCGDPTKICNTLFAIYHEDNHDTLSITDALNVLQGWSAGKYGASYMKSADMDYLINTLLAVLLSKCRCGSVNKMDWMKMADDYPEFFDVEPQYPQHVRYLRLMDRFRKELAHNPAKLPPRKGQLPVQRVQ